MSFDKVPNPSLPFLANSYFGLSSDILKRSDTPIAYLAQALANLNESFCIPK